MTKIMICVFCITNSSGTIIIKVNNNISIVNILIIDIVPSGT